MAEIIVPYARNRIGYAVIKSLSKAGLETIAADCTKIAMGRWSRYADGFITYPDPYNDKAAFIGWANEQLVKKRLIFPTFTESWILKQHGLDSLPLPKYQHIFQANNKLFIHNLCTELGIPTPESWYITDGVLKPLDSRGAKGRQYIKDVLVQDRIYGDAIGVGMLFNKGNLKAKFSWRRLAEFPSDGGMSVIRESIKAPDQEANAEMLLSAMSWHGVAMVEFKGQHVIEVNPRFWGSLQLAIDSGVDFPKLLAQMMIRGDCPIVTEWQVGVKTSWLAGCILRRCRPQGNLEDFSTLDILPFFGQFATVIQNIITGRGVVLDEH